ncbi:MAG: DUF192 domain-containing protein [bacterium]|nr:DUF192 domain-containing protein [bacterium]
MKELKTLFIYILITMGVTGCVFAQLKMIPLHIGSETFTVEIADTQEKQLRGLMFRKTVPDDFGMLFVHNAEGYRSIWMKNCFVHLDLLFLNKYKQVVDIYINVPPCKAEPCESYVTHVPAQYVLELRGKRAEELKVKIGDTIFFILD